MVHAMSTQHQLLKEIKAFLKRTGMKASTFGEYAVGNSRLVAKLEEGGTISIKTLDEVRAYMAKPVKPKERKRKSRPLGRVVCTA